MDDLFRGAWAALTAPGAQFAWSESEVRGIPMRTYDQAPPSMRFIWELASGYADRDYLVFEDERMTYAEAHEHVNGLIAHLESVGVGKGDHVAIAMRNYPEWVLAYWGILSMGAVAVGMNAWWVAKEMQYGIEDSAPKALVCDSERLEVLQPVLSDIRVNLPLPIIAVRTEGELPENSVAWTDAVATENSGLPAVDVQPDDPACIFYTSGTTGFPKGAILTHRSCCSNLFNMGFGLGLLTTAGKMAAEAQGLEVPADDGPPIPVAMLATPLFHVTANNCGLHPVTVLGGKTVLIHKWDAKRAMELIEREKVSTISCVPVMSREIVDHPELENYDLSSLGTLGGGGAAVQPDLVAKIASRTTSAPATGYGLTETSGIISIVGGPWFQAKPKSCGPAVPTVETRVVDPDGNDVAQGEVGELWVKGPNNVIGYHNKPEATAEAFTDGWFHTGDLCYIDGDDFIFIVDRAKDMVLRGGENIYCAEVEAGLFEHASVKECAVFAIPDERLGEVVGAAVVCHDGQTITAEELQEHAGQYMAKHKVPTRVWILDEDLPRNASGKFVKRTLQEALLGD